MAETWLKIAGLDPLLFRDGRPFSSEDGALTARTLPLPLPGTVAGFLRTFYGNQQGWEWNRATAAQASQISVHAPLILRNGEPVYSAPADAVLYEGTAAPPVNGRSSVRVMKLRPWLGLNNGAGCNLPHPSLAPLKVTEDAKPTSGNRLWSRELMERWLLDAASNGDTILRTEFHEGLPADERVHVSIDPASGKGEDGRLFTTHRLGFEDHTAVLNGSPFMTKTDEESVCWALAARAEVDLTPGIGTLGGERGLAFVEIADGRCYHCPASVRDKLSNVQVGGPLQVRMILATPAIFEGGWLPRWLREHRGRLEGAPPGTQGLTLRLICVAAGRREAVSGWDFQTGKPKTVRWMAPAGAVYFFDIVEGDVLQLGEPGRWLAPVSDAGQDRNDGYGLALWGFWTRNDNDNGQGEVHGGANR